MSESAGTLCGFSARLPKSGKIALVVIPAVVLLMSGCGHSESWQYGYNEGREYGPGAVSQGWSKESACRSVARGFDPQVTLNQDAYEGCLAALK